jgi:DNA-binding MarR family transcriptional regulator
MEKRLGLISLFTGSAMSITAKEIAVLDAIRSHGRTGACCADLQETILAHTGKKPQIATLYAILAELERKGLIEHFASAQHKKGGRPRQAYVLTDSGRLAIDLGEAIVSRVAHPVPA